MNEILYFNPNYTFNVYDIRIKCKDGSFCDYDDTSLENLFNKPNIKKILGVQGRNFEVCDDNVYNFLFADEIKDASFYIKKILDSGLNVLVYYGD